MSETPTLAPPGAGLPKAEAFLVRHLIFPVLRLQLSRQKSDDLFRKSGDEILTLVAPLDLEQLQSPVLIKRLPGMEDSSRFWSVEQTLEHIQIAAGGILFIIRQLELGRPLDLIVRTEDLKPSGGLGLDRVRAFREFREEIPQTLSRYSFASPATHFHPWFGDLRSLDWFRLMAFHQNLHRKQIRLILRGLKGEMAAYARLLRSKLKGFVSDAARRSSGAGQCAQKPPRSVSSHPHSLS
ncbi:MAG: DinB family protein [Verrucomicrobiota bacterium]